VKRPVIGMCAAVERARWGVWDELVCLLPLAYARPVQRAGGLALILPPDHEALEDPDSFLGIIDGLLLAGGRDVDPSTYGAEPHPEITSTCPPRDEFEVALARRALEVDFPTLAICRGMEVLNVAAGGTLKQHLPDELGHELHRTTPGAFSDHMVRLEPGSLAARAAGEERQGVKSHHHQGVAEIGEGLEVTGWAAEGGLVEALEHPERRFVLGVLWHPEQDEASRVIGSLVEAARAPLESRSEAGRR